MLDWFFEKDWRLNVLVTVTWIVSAFLIFCTFVGCAVIIEKVTP